VAASYRRECWRLNSLKHWESPSLWASLWRRRKLRTGLLRHPAVTQCGVIGHDEADGPVKPRRSSSRAPRPEALAEDIKQFVKSKLALYIAAGVLW
jgi:hypothetical protein